MRWQDDYPCDSGSIDGADSARLVGIMAVFNHPIFVICSDYAKRNYIDEYYYLRHPIEKNKYPFSRDQAVCLFAGLHVQGSSAWVNPNYKPQNDFISPSVRGHFKRCAGLTDTWLERMWLYLDVVYSAKIDPLAEPNQLICMLMIADPKYLRLWCKLNKSWQESITAYWNGWRGEPELVELMIETIQNRIS